MTHTESDGTSTSCIDGSSSAKSKDQYSLVKGIFAQDEDDFLPTADQIQPRLGLLDGAGQWPDVRALNDAAPEGVSFKLIIAGRHGQGYHNVAIEKYSSEVWRNKLAVLEGDGEIKWGPDPLLTSVGLEQAKTAHEAWKKYTPPTPDVFFCSPHRRALRTCAITFPGQRVKVLEDIREKLSGHTCDVRSPIDSTLTSEFPSFDFSSFAYPVDPDPCADLRRETDEDVAARVGRVLDYVFDTERDAQVVSITAHAGWIRGLFDVTGRYRYQLNTGGITPLLVRAEKV
ncbi:phosphoglycerate mutase-like protein [Exidia glandulosa HHB12029]|uniref:Phosphoglycerate mutase-like protein n=1 Tax=Exidia glandulosa HHB12029 TaxID=1314781 RepID=A0A166AD07_EXIGL|nr:phosphoglycerate mutase-like protein [Exidia glandulosa HHB12029]